MFKQFLTLIILAVLFATLSSACSNSEYTGWDNIIVSQDSNDSADSSSKLDYLPIDDSEYPYAGIPRIVIITENYREIKDRETDIPAKLQIWGEHTPKSEIMDLTIRGRGNTSWTEMPKKSYKIEFINKQAMLGMPKDRDWALIANYADKTLMKNYLAYHLSAKLGAYYAPRCEFAELFLNKEYLGIYLLTETIKTGKNRVNIPQNNNSFIAEISKNYHKKDQVVFSHVITADSVGRPFHIHNPKNSSEETLSAIKDDIENFEKHLKTIKNHLINNVAQYLDINECVKHYWVQEISQNPDAAGYSSIYFSWMKDGPIRMGPVWDFDLAFGSHNNESINGPENWYVKTGYWHSYIFKDSIANQSRIDFWNKNKDILTGIIDAVDSIHVLLQTAAENNFKKWNILKSTEYRFHNHAYATYNDAVEDLKDWICKRIAWIDSHI